MSSKSLIGESWKFVRILSDMIWNSDVVLRNDDVEEAVKMGRTGAVVVRIARVIWQSQALTVSFNKDAEAVCVEL